MKHKWICTECQNQEELSKELLELLEKEEQVIFMKHCKKCGHPMKPSEED